MTDLIDLSWNDGVTCLRCYSVLFSISSWIAHYVRDGHCEYRSGKVMVRLEVFLNRRLAEDNGWVGSEVAR